MREILEDGMLDKDGNEEWMVELVVVVVEVVHTRVYLIDCHFATGPNQKLRAKIREAGKRNPTIISFLPAPSCGVHRPTSPTATTTQAGW